MIHIVKKPLLLRKTTQKVKFINNTKITKNSKEKKLYKYNNYFKCNIYKYVNKL